jgi:hypothetical protein
MIDPKLALVMLAALGIYYGAITVWHGVEKVGHGAKAVACELHTPFVHCPKKPDAKKP